MAAAAYPFRIAATHYETLGVVETASSEEIHAAYKRLARRVHPDAGGSAAQMAAVNEAYRVLSDAGRRALYDSSRRPTVGAGGPSPRFHAGSSAQDTSDDDVEFVPMAPWKLRIPFWSMAVLGTLFAVFLFTAYAGSRTPTPTGKLPPVDGRLAVNECVVVVGADAHAEEVPCAGRRDGVVMGFLTFEQQCETGLVGVRRLDAAGLACVKLG